MEQFQVEPPSGCSFSLNSPCWPLKEEPHSRLACRWEPVRSLDMTLEHSLWNSVPSMRTIPTLLSTFSVAKKKMIVAGSSV